MSAPDITSSPLLENETKIQLDEKTVEKTMSKGSKKSVSDLSDQSRSRSGSEKSRSVGDVKSHRSSDLSTVAKGRKKKKVTDADGAHRVTFTITIAKAVPTVEEDEGPAAKEGVRKKRTMDAPKPQGFFHYEYNLLPDDEDTVKTDVVTFGVAAKIYTDRQEPKVLRTWQDGDQTWVAWTHCHTVTITDRLLMKLYDHTVNLHVWDSKEKLATRARFDRPKAFRLPQGKSGDQSDTPGSGVKALVIKQARSYRRLQPKKCGQQRYLPGSSEPTSRSTTALEMGPADGPVKGRGEEDLVDPLKNVKLPSQATTMMSTLIQEQKDQVLSKTTGVPLRTYSRLGRVAGLKGILEQESAATTQKAKDSSFASAHSRNAGRATPSGSAKSAPRKASSGGIMSSQKLNEALSTLVEREEDDAAAGRSIRPGHGSPRRLKKDAGVLESVHKGSVCSISLKLAKLFAGLQNLTERLDIPVAGIDDMFMSVSLSGPLMSEDQRQALNPLVITVHSATDMPATPLSYEQLSHRCAPVYIKYAPFVGQSSCSQGQPHAEDIYWDDISVMLTGLMEPAELRERLQGAPLEVEVHDRDYIKVNKEVKPSLFGDDTQDEKISNVGVVSSKRTTNNAFQDHGQAWNPYGVAKFDLSGLLQGQQVVHLTSPIMACPIPDVLGLGTSQTDNGGKLVGIPGSVDGPVKTPIAAGHYLQSGAALKIRVSITYPLTTPSAMLAKVSTPASTKCPFARIVFKFAYKNVEFLHKLHTLVMDVNAQALQLQDLPPHVIQAALSTYKLSLDQQESRCLDIVTGFQLLDGEMHLFVLEGLHSAAIAYIWNAMPMPENTDVEVLYNSEFRFSQRLYGALDVDLCRIKLHEPLSVVVQQALLYVRDMVPPPCFHAISRLDMLMKTHRLRDAVKNVLFPTAEMIVSLSKEFGVPLTEKDFEDLNPEADLMDEDVQPPCTEKSDRPAWIPIDRSNEAFLIELEQRKQTKQQDFRKANMEFVKNTSEKNAIVHSEHAPEKVYIGAAFNYSSQALNSTSLSKEKLLQILSKNTNRRYTYSSKFHHSSTVEHVDSVTMDKKEAAESRHRWRRATGWHFPGPRNSKETNKHPRTPHISRVQELRTSWTENSLHAVNRPTVAGRGPFRWQDAHRDMNLWSQVAGGRFQTSIHLPGEPQRREKLASLQREQEAWSQRLVVDSPHLYNHRCAVRTELTARGRWATNQLSLLTGLLKDAPQKYSLREPAFLLQPITPLDVITHPHDGRRTPPETGFMPGPNANEDWKKNYLQSYDYQHKTFIDAKGQDFNVIYKDRCEQYKKTIDPLSEDERKMDMYEWPVDGEVGRCGGYVLPTADDYELLMTNVDNSIYCNPPPLASQTVQ